MRSSGACGAMDSPTAVFLKEASLVTSASLDLTAMSSGTRCILASSLSALRLLSCPDLLLSEST